MNVSTITDKLKQYPLAVICVGLLLACVVLFFLRGGVATELSIKESDLNSRIRTIEENIKNSNNLEEDTEALASMIEEIQTLVFDQYERAVNISFFYEFEDKADVVISNISQLPNPDPIYSNGPRKLKLYSTLVYNLTVSGSFTNILKLVYEIDRADPIIRVADIQVVRSKGRTEDGNVSAKLRVLVMSQND